MPDIGKKHFVYFVSNENETYEANYEKLLQDIMRIRRIEYSEAIRLLNMTSLQHPLILSETEECWREYR